MSDSAIPEIDPRNPGIMDLYESSFFVLRTPLLPFEELMLWGDGLKCSAAYKVSQNGPVFSEAWVKDVNVLRERLRNVIDRPEVSHALFVGSHALQSGIDHWKRNPDSKKGLQAERAVVRYFERMASRPTPFGTFAGYSVGEVDQKFTSVHLYLEGREKYRVSTRIDFSYLFALTSTLRRDPLLARRLVYHPNSSLHRVPGGWHYVEFRAAGNEFSYHLVKMFGDEYLDGVLECAENGATFTELVRAILTRSSGSEISGEDAHEYISELISSQVLVSTVSPLVTGRAALDDLIDQLSGLQRTDIATTLQTVRSQLAEFDAKGVCRSESGYGQIASALAALPLKMELEKTFQVDMIKPVQCAVLGKQIVAELLTGVDLLCRVGEAFEPEELRLFRQAFSDRFGGARVPILEALDEDFGVGFGHGAPDSSPILHGLRLGGASHSAESLSDWHAVLLRKVVESAQAGNTELRLDMSDFPVTKNSYHSRLPDSFSLTISLAASAASAFETGAFDIFLMAAVIPCGAKLFGRFCQNDPDLERHVRELLQSEQRHNSDAVYAEIVHLPDGRLGNVLCRPVLRDYEIPYLARSGAPQERQITMDDLLVEVLHGRIILYSKRLGREVIPRLTNAHGFMNPALAPAYRFLCSLQQQGGYAFPDFSWGPLDNLDFLPRVRVGRLVLSPARWRLSGRQIHEVASLSSSGRFRAMQELRQRLNLPRWIVLRESDNGLTTDLENPLSVDALVHVLKRRGQGIVVEMYPPADLLCVKGPEGRFHHEIIVPFVRRLQRGATQRDADGQHATVVHSLTQRAIRTIGPGKDWLFVKLYGGDGTLDEVLTAAVMPLLRRARESGPPFRWFFIRYADPHVHLRIRFNGSPDWLHQQLMPRISECFDPLLVAGGLWKIQFDTYDREIERYGGTEAMSIAEDIFCADSDAVIEVLNRLDEGKEADCRWRIALLSIDRLLSDFGLDLEEKNDTLERFDAAMNIELKTTGMTKRQLSEKFRREGRKIDALLRNPLQDTLECSIAVQILEGRTRRIVPLVHRLQLLRDAGTLRADFTDLLFSYVHMHVNRLMRSSARLHELVLYHFLFNSYHAMCARNAHERLLKVGENKLESGEKSIGSGVTRNPELVR